MKITLLLASLLIINTSILIGQITIQLLENAQTFFLVVSQTLLLFGYYLVKTLKEVQGVFDIDVSL